MRSTRTVTMVVVAFLAACGGKREPAQPAAADTTGRMAGMATGGQGAQLLALMQPHLDSLMTMPATQLAAAVPAHEGLASRVLDAMGAEMRGMGMKPDSAWNALADSVREDLAALPTVSGAQLKGRFQAHAGRMGRLLTAHAAMMKM